ncbi:MULTISPECIES: hypothetical protein [Bacillus cereus group]|uniref:Uncharacterized protein n=1 Tax=Bacillus thuringiensis subsp. jegathesan TaxID=56955 RepID=A0A9X6MNY7_BACTJ|nr:hypothetical protein [Bacillus thuringiensis]ONG72187.1 hypothetical protein BKK44_10390 [Bacillus cereus]OUB76931.1 hypothetical protein BK750_03405 [Bacillus thuringiensis serovar jegathesan]
MYAELSSLETVGNTIKVRFSTNRSVKEVIEPFDIQKNIKQKIKCGNFFLKRLRREVKHASKKEKRNWLRILKGLLITTTLVIGNATPAFAAESLTADVFTMPLELIQLFVGLLVITVIIAIGIALIASVLAGICRMIRKGKLAHEWTNDIIRGLVQVLLLPLTIFCIILFFHFLFGNMDWYIDPVNYLPAFKDALEDLFRMRV